MGWDWRSGQREQLLLWLGGTWRGSVPIFGSPRFQHSSHPWNFVHHDISARQLAQPMPYPGHGGGPLTTNLAESWGELWSQWLWHIVTPSKTERAEGSGLQEYNRIYIQVIFTVFTVLIPHIPYRVQDYCTCLKFKLYLCVRAATQRTMSLLHFVPRGCRTSSTLSLGWKLPVSPSWAFDKCQGWMF